MIALHEATTTLTSTVHAEKKFRRITGYQHMPMLIETLKDIDKKEDAA